MSGVFDRLDKEIKVKQQKDGITALDLVDLPRRANGQAGYSATHP
jgi:hypothetical protein